MSANKYAAGRDYGFWLDINGQLQVFGELWAYNLPQTPSTPVGTYVRLDGSAGTRITGPDIAALAGAQTLTVEMDCSLDDWTPASDMQLVDQSLRSLPPQTAWRMEALTRGAISEDVSSDGGNIDGRTTGVLGFVDSSRHTVGFVWTAVAGANSTHQFRFDGADYGTATTNHPARPAGLYNSAEPIIIGATSNDNNRAIGNIYALRLYADGNLVASPDFMTMKAGQTAITDAQGNVWTLSGGAHVVEIPANSGGTPLNNKLVVALEEPEVGGVRPASGGFMLGEQGQIIGIGNYDPDYWANFPPDIPPPGPQPDILIPSTTTGFTDITASPEMGMWVLTSDGHVQLGYISTLSSRYSAIIGNTMLRPPPTGGGYTSIAAGKTCVYVLDAAGAITVFGFAYPVFLNPDPADGVWKKVVASNSHAAGLSTQGKILWWPESPTDTDTITAIQTPPTGKNFEDVAVGEDFTYALVDFDDHAAGGQVNGYGAPLGATNGSFVALTPPGHTGISQGPLVNTWGFAVVEETLNNPFGVTVFGPNAPTSPIQPYSPSPPANFDVTRYLGSKNQLYFSWESSLSGISSGSYELARGPVVAGAAPPTAPPDGTVPFKTVQHNDSSTIQTTDYVAPDHGDYYYFVRAIGRGGPSAGGASAWSVTHYNTTLLTEPYRKIAIDLADVDCQIGGFVVMVDIDDVFEGEDGWTGAQVDYTQVPAGVYYFPVGTKVSVARQTGTVIGNTKITMIDVNGLTDIVVIPSPKRWANAIVDYEVAIEQTYRYWVHDVTQVISTGSSYGVDSPTILDECRSEIPEPHYLRCLTSVNSLVTSAFCLGHLDQLDYQIRSGVFSVMGRPAPVVVVDSRSTATGHLIFLSSGQESVARSELHLLRDMFRLGQPMMLQTEFDYELADGQLYFQPTQVSDRWVGADARRPEHAIEVDFVEIDPPRGRTIVRNIGIPLQTPKPTLALEEPPGYFDWPGEENLLFGLPFCDGGMLERYGTCDNLRLKSDGRTFRSCNEVFHTPAETVC